VQGFELVLAVVDGVSSAVDCGGLEGVEGGGGHCGGLIDHSRAEVVVVFGTIFRVKTSYWSEPEVKKTV
jgi:hypothetical protein